MMYKAAMKASILIQILFAIVFHIVNGSIRDFIIADESDLKLFGDIETESDSEMDQIYDWDSEEYIYDSCYTENAADKYLDQFYDDGFEEIDNQDEDEKEEYNAIESMENIFSGSESRLNYIKEIVKKLSKDPRYVTIIEQEEHFKDHFNCPNCQDDYYDNLLC